jgi:hypothetical protein
MNDARGMGTGEGAGYLFPHGDGWFKEEQALRAQVLLQGGPPDKLFDDEGRSAPGQVSVVDSDRVWMR